MIVMFFGSLYLCGLFYNLIAAIFLYLTLS